MIEHIFTRILEKTESAKEVYKKRILSELGTIKDIEEYKLYVGKITGINECESLIRNVYQELCGDAIQEIPGEIIKNVTR